MPPYANRPFCLYLIHLLSNTTLLSDFLYARYLLDHILQCLKREQTIEAEMQKYEGNVYDLEEQCSEVAINAFTRTRALSHPLGSGSGRVDVYESFRKMWGCSVFKREFVDSFEGKTREYIDGLLCQRMVNQKLRKIYRVRREGPVMQVKEEGIMKE